MALPRLALLIGELLEIQVTSRNQGNYCSPIQPSSAHGLISLVSSTFLCAQIQSFLWELASSAFLQLVTGPPKYLLQHLSLHDFLAHTSASPRIRILVVLMLVFPLFSPNNLLITRRLVLYPRYLPLLQDREDVELHGSFPLMSGIKCEDVQIFY